MSSGEHQKCAGPKPKVCLAKGVGRRGKDWHGRHQRRLEAVAELQECGKGYGMKMQRKESARDCPSLNTGGRPCWVIQPLPNLIAGHRLMRDPGWVS